MVAHASQAAHRHHALQDALQDLARQQDRITEGIKLGGSIPALVAELKSLQARRTEIEEDLAGLHVLSSRGEIKKLVQEVQVRLRDWESVIHEDPRQARQMLRKVLTERIRFTPSADGWVEFSAMCSLGKLLDGIVIPKELILSGTGGPKKVVAPTGFEPVFQS